MCVGVGYECGVGYVCVWGLCYDAVFLCCSCLLETIFFSMVYSYVTRGVCKGAVCGVKRNGVCEGNVKCMV